MCVEGLWLELLSRVNLIDDISLRCSLDTFSSAQRVINLHLVDLLRNKEARAAYGVKWMRDGMELVQFANQTSISVESERVTFTVHVQFFTEEVRIDPLDYLQSTVEINVPPCNLQ